MSTGHQSVNRQNVGKWIQPHGKFLAVLFPKGRFCAGLPSSMLCFLPIVHRCFGLYCLPLHNSFFSSSVSLSSRPCIFITITCLSLCSSSRLVPVSIFDDIFCQFFTDISFIHSKWSSSKANTFENKEYLLNFAFIKGVRKSGKKRSQFRVS